MSDTRNQDRSASAKSCGRSGYRGRHDRSGGGDKPTPPRQCRTAGCPNLLGSADINRCSKCQKDMAGGEKQSAFSTAPMSSATPPLAPAAQNIPQHDFDAEFNRRYDERRAQERQEEQLAELKRQVDEANPKAEEAQRMLRARDSTDYPDRRFIDPYGGPSRRTQSPAPGQSSYRSSRRPRSPTPPPQRQSRSPPRRPRSRSPRRRPRSRSRSPAVPPPRLGSSYRPRPQDPQGRRSRSLLTRRPPLQRRSPSRPSSHASRRPPSPLRRPRSQKVDDPCRACASTGDRSHYHYDCPRLSAAQRHTQRRRHAKKATEPTGLAAPTLVQDSQPTRQAPQPRSESTSAGAQVSSGATEVPPSIIEVPPSTSGVPSTTMEVPSTTAEVPSPAPMEQPLERPVPETATGGPSTLASMVRDGLAQMATLPENAGLTPLEILIAYREELWMNREKGYLARLPNIPSGKVYIWLNDYIAHLQRQQQ